MLLEKGFYTSYGGAFLLLPYMLALNLEKLISALEIVKERGISTLQSVLALLFLALIGKKRVSKMEKLKDYGIAILAGFSKLPSKSYFHEFLDSIAKAKAEAFIVVSAKAFEKLGIYGGRIVNLDRHFMGYFGECRVGKDKHPTRNISMSGVNAFFTQDQETGNPVFVRVEYPGLCPEEIALPMLEVTREILPELEKAVFDKWFSVGALLDYLDKKMKLKFVTLVKLFDNRIEEMKSISREEFRELVGTDRMIAFKDTTLRNYSGVVKLIVVRFMEEGEEKYYGYLTNDFESEEEVILEEKSRRWDIENFFKECDFLGLDALPSIELNKIAGMMGMRFLGYALVACLRKDLGEGFERKTVESIFEEIVFAPALVKAKGDELVVTFYGNYKENFTMALTKLAVVLEEKGLNQPIPWLGNRRLQIRFK